MDTEKITWEALEHQTLEKEADWFWALGIISVSAAITSTILGNVLFGVLILSAGAAMGLVAMREPRVVEFTLSKKGLSVGKNLFTIDHLNSFWIVEPNEEDGEYLLLVDTPKFMTPDLTIPLSGVNPETVHMWFTSHEVPEIELHESFTLKLFKLFGF